MCDYSIMMNSTWQNIMKILKVMLFMALGIATINCVTVASDTRPAFAVHNNGKVATVWSRDSDDLTGAFRQVYSGSPEEADNHLKRLFSPNAQIVDSPQPAPRQMLDFPPDFLTPPPGRPPYGTGGLW
jgi:hypothetical protein